MFDISKLFPSYYNYVYIILTTACNVVISLHIILLLLWIIVLFNNIIRLRRKEKYSTLTVYNQDTALDALNRKVEYRKNLFLIAIVVCEFISCLFTVGASSNGLVIIVNEYINDPRHFPNTTFNATSDPQFSSDYSHNCNVTRYISDMWGFSNNLRSRIVFALFDISFIITFSLVYTLMSYYVTVTKKSLNYNISLKSVDIVREQKILLLVSPVICLVLLVLLVRVEVYIVFRIVESCFAIIQSILTYRYSKKLVQVLNWKLKDTEIAFGTDDYQYKLYNKTLKTFKWFAFFFNLVVVFFCLYSLLNTINILITISNPRVIYAVYKVCIPVSTSYAAYLNILRYIGRGIVLIEKVPLSISLLLLFSLNLSTTPFLLSRINFRCRLNCKRFAFQGNKQLRETLLK